MNEIPPSQKKPTSAISWLGFGLSILVFIIIWIVNILLFNVKDDKSFEISSIYLIEIFVCGFLGFMALVFSSIGLYLAVKNQMPHRIAIFGIVTCALCILSFVVPPICVGLLERQPVQAETPESVLLANETPDGQQADVTIQVFKYGEIRFINNKDANNPVIANMSTLDYNFDKQVGEWLKLNHLDASNSFEVCTTNQADFSDINKLLDALRKNGITKFSLSSSLNESDYF